MDNVTEALVLGRVLGHLRGRTVIMIAHRLDTLRGADRIMLMKDGCICGQGNYNELARENPYFMELLRKQNEK